MGYISISSRSMAINLSKVVTYCEMVQPLRPDYLTLITRKIVEIICIHFRKRYGQQTWQGAESKEEIQNANAQSLHRLLVKLLFNFYYSLSLIVFISFSSFLPSLNITLRLKIFPCQVSMLQKMSWRTR